jgi:hypothetical protein
MRFILTILLAASGAASAASPRKINFQGRLVDPATGDPREGPFAMTFRIYDAPSGGSPLYAETQDPVGVSNGVFSVQIGSVVALPPELFLSASAYLGVQVGADSEMSPRQQLVMAPYAASALQLSAPDGARVRAGPAAYSTFTSAGNLLLPYGLEATTGTFAASGASVYSVSAASGILSSAGTVRVLGAGGVHADYGVLAATAAVTSHFVARGLASSPGTASSGRARLYYDTTEDEFRVSVNARPYAPLGGTTVTMWNTNATAGVANQGLNLPAALTELDSATQGTRQLIDCDDLPSQLALRYNFRSLAATALTITLSVRDVTDTANILVSASQSVNATQNWVGQGAFASKPGWCTGTQTVAVYTSGGNGAWDGIFKHIILVGKP